MYVRGVDNYLHALARRAGHLPASAVCDLLQEVFLRAFSAQARQSYDGLRDFGAYLNAIARNCFLDGLRRQRREVPLALDDLPAETASAPVGGDHDPKVRSVLRAYVDALPHDLRGVYQHRYVFGASQEAACEALGVTRRRLRTAEAHLRRGLKKALVSAGVFAAPAAPLAAREAQG